MISNVSTGKDLYLKITVTVLVIALAIVSAYLTIGNNNEQGEQENEAPLLDVSGYCTLTGNIFLCDFIIFNYDDSIASINNFTIGDLINSITVNFKPPLILKETSRTSVLLSIDKTGRYLVITYDGVTELVMKGKYTGSFPSNILNESSYKVFETNKTIIATSGLLPFELNDLELISNDTTSYFSLLSVYSNRTLDYLDIKVMELHDRLSWERIVNSYKNGTFFIPLQYGVYPVMNSYVKGFPSRITVEFEAGDRIANISVNLSILETRSVVLEIYSNNGIYRDYLPAVDPQWLISEWINLGEYNSTFLPR